jgi:uncharacterized protein (DUF58 family)
MTGISPLRLVKTDATAGSQRKTPPPLPRNDSILNIEDADRFKNLLLFARSKVEGYFAGRHKSPYYGSNVEFADYQEYVPGEDVGNIDWRVYGRTRKLFLRKYEEETDMVAYLVVDASGSMQYRGTPKQDTKFQHAIKIAAVLAYLMTRQGDKASLTLFAEKLRKFVPPGGTRRHLYNLINELEVAKPAARTLLHSALGECNALFRKRGCIIVLSDLLGDPQQLFDALGQFVHRKYEVLLLQVMDPDELDLPSTDIARFIDMETAEHVEVDPGEIRKAYRETMQKFLDEISSGANQRRIEHALVKSSDPYLSAIEAWIGFRGRSRIRK